MCSVYNVREGMQYSLTGIFGYGHMGIVIALLSALAEPNRLAIVELLRRGPLTVGSIAERLGLRQPQASKHLKILREDNILEVRADGNRRFYALRPEPFQDLNQWASSFEGIMAQRFDNLDAYLLEVQRKKKRKRGAKR